MKKVLSILIFLIMSILMVGSIFAQEIENSVNIIGDKGVVYSIPPTDNKAVQLNIDTIFGYGEKQNSKIYCMQPGVNITTKNNPKVGIYDGCSEIEITDPRLIYILSLPDETYKSANKNCYTKNSGVSYAEYLFWNSNDVKQNLLWWYIESHVECEAQQNGVLNCDICKLKEYYVYKNTETGYLLRNKKLNGTLSNDGKTCVYNGKSYNLENIDELELEFWNKAFNQSAKSLTELKNTIVTKGYFGKVSKAEFEVLFNIKKIRLELYKAEISEINSIVPCTIEKIKEDECKFIITGDFSKLNIYAYNEDEAKVEGFQITDKYLINNEKITYYTVELDNNGNKVLTFNKDNMEDKNKIHIECVNEKSKANVFILFSNGEKEPQNLMVINNIADKVVAKGEFELNLIINVSLQKYVSQVTDKNNNEYLEYIDNRKNKDIDVLDTPKGHSSAINRDVNTEISTIKACKLPTAVEIKPGEIVEYTITVYNNIEKQSNKFEIQDNYQVGELVKIITENNEELYPNNSTNYELNINEEEKQINIKNIMLDASTTEKISEKTFKVYIKYNEYLNSIIKNEAKIIAKNNKAENKYRTYDADFVQMKQYRVSLQKIVYSVNGKTEGITSFNRWNSWECEDKNKINKETAYKKYNNPVTVQYKDTITYAIKVKNDGEENIKNIQIEDQLPKNGLLSKVSINKLVDQYQIEITEESELRSIIINPSLRNGNIITFTLNTILEPGEEIIVYIDAYVNAENKSVQVYRNYAKIIDIQNDKNISVEDSTPGDNQDADYFQTKDIIISGMVWNDKALNKTQDKYNGVFDKNEETKLANIKVYLYREELLADINRDGVVNSTDLLLLKNFLNNYKTEKNDINIIDLNKDGKLDNKDVALADLNGDGQVDTTDYLQFKTSFYYSSNAKKARKVAETITDENGEYKFEVEEIKGPKKIGTNRWAGKYYSYFIVFEYNGIVYTSTPDGITCVDIDNLEAYKNGSYKINSNAKECNNKEELDLLVTRQELNNKFSIINNESNIKYKTENEKGYIPQSKYIHNEDDNKIHSSTNLINIEDVSEEQLKYVNLGLRGRDTFDLELTASVDNINIIANNKSGVYRTDSVNLRKSDINLESEDIVNSLSEVQEEYVTEETINIKKSDIVNPKVDFNGDNKYGDTGIAVEIIYKVSVKNASITAGTATKITNYYDSKYSFVKAYYMSEEGEKELNYSAPQLGTNYNYITIDTQATILNQSEKMDIYLVYKLNYPENTLISLTEIEGAQKIITYNMSEIAEYKTVDTIDEDGSKNEATRGLIDKDSAPGSANKEQVRLKTTEGKNASTANGITTTVEYYFNGKTLNDLKYEDDTYVASTLYFALLQEDVNGSDYNAETVGNMINFEEIESKEEKMNWWEKLLNYIGIY